jgi:hypothetical protein
MRRESNEVDSYLVCHCVAIWTLSYNALRPRRMPFPAPLPLFVCALIFLFLLVLLIVLPSPCLSLFTRLIDLETIHYSPAVSWS